MKAVSVAAGAATSEAVGLLRGPPNEMCSGAPVLSLKERTLLSFYSQSTAPEHTTCTCTYRSTKPRNRQPSIGIGAHAPRAPSGHDLGPARTHPSPQAALARKSKIAQTSSKHHGPGTSVTPCFSCRSLQFPPQTAPHSNLIKIVWNRDGHFTGNAKKATIGISPNIRRFDT